MEETKQTEWELVTEYGIPAHMCPTCAVYPQLLYNKEDEMWAIRCPMCGYQQAWGVKDFDETYIPMMARLFNVGLMSLEVGVETMLLYGVKNGDYLVYTEEDKSFLQGFENVFEAIDFMKKHKENGLATGVYYLWDNYLHRMFGSFVFEVDWANIALEDFELHQEEQE